MMMCIVNLRRITPLLMLVMGCGEATNDVFIADAGLKQSNVTPAEETPPESEPRDDDSAESVADDTDVSKEAHHNILIVLGRHWGVERDSEAFPPNNGEKQ